MKTRILHFEGLDNPEHIVNKTSTESFTAPMFVNKDAANGVCDLLGISGAERTKAMTGAGEDSFFGKASGPFTYKHLSDKASLETMVQVFGGIDTLREVINDLIKEWQVNPAKVAEGQKVGLERREAWIKKHMGGMKK